MWAKRRSKATPIFHRSQPGNRANRKLIPKHRRTRKGPACPVRELEPPAIEKCILPDEDRVGPLAGECREARIDFSAGPPVDDLRLKSYGTAGCFHLAQRGLRIAGIGWIDEHGDTESPRQHFTHQLKPLCRQLG